MRRGGGRGRRAPPRGWDGQGRRCRRSRRACGQRWAGPGPAAGRRGAARGMWPVEAPAAEPSVPAPADPPESPRAPASPCSSPGLGSGSLPPDSLQALPSSGSPRESPSIQCDSLECPCCGSGSASLGAGEDSLQGPLAACPGRGCSGTCHSNPAASSRLSDSLESSLAQHDSLQSVCSLCESFRSSSINGDSLESLSSLSSGSASQ